MLKLEHLNKYSYVQVLAFFSSLKYAKSDKQEKFSKDNPASFIIAIYYKNSDSLVINVAKDFVAIHGICYKTNINILESISNCTTVFIIKNMVTKITYILGTVAKDFTTAPFVAIATLMTRRL